MDAVIVLANLMGRDGALNEESAGRAALAVEVFRDASAGVLVPCGWAYRDDTDLTIADAFRTHLIEGLGVPFDRVLVERESRDTVGDAVFTRRHTAIPRQWSEIGVVTSDYHVLRAREIFEFVYGGSCAISVFGAGTTVTAEVKKHEVDSINAFRRTFDGVSPGDIDNIEQRMWSSHPFYDGRVDWSRRA